MHARINPKHHLPTKNLIRLRPNFRAGFNVIIDRLTKHPLKLPHALTMETNHVADPHNTPQKYVRPRRTRHEPYNFRSSSCSCRRHPQSRSAPSPRPAPDQRASLSGGRRSPDIERPKRLKRQAMLGHIRIPSLNRLPVCLTTPPAAPPQRPPTPDPGRVDVNCASPADPPAPYLSPPGPEQTQWRIRVAPILAPSRR
jgi:hypothetical protein